LVPCELEDSTFADKLDTSGPAIDEEELDTTSTLDEELDAGTSFFATPAAANSGA
jgi:hypothetical protein